MSTTTRVHRASPIARRAFDAADGHLLSDAIRSRKADELTYARIGAIGCIAVGLSEIAFIPGRLFDWPRSALLAMLASGWAGRGRATGTLPEDPYRIFDSLFTTRSKGGGTDRGHSIDHGIIADHEGRMEHAPSTRRRGVGACFRATLAVERTGSGFPAREAP